MSNVNDFDRVGSGNPVEDLGPVGLHDLHSDIGVVRPLKAVGLLGDSLDAVMNRSEYIARADRASAFEVLSNRIDIGERTRTIFDLHVTPCRFQNSLTSSWGMICPRSASAIAVRSSSLKT